MTVYSESTEQTWYFIKAKVIEHYQYIHLYHSGKLTVAEHSMNLSHHTVLHQ
jgi:hypothetical protein